MRTCSARGLLLILLLGSAVFLTGIPDAGGAPETIATVGGICIEARDISYKMAIERAYGNETITESVALVMLVTESIEKEVGRMFRIEATADERSALRRHADEHSRAPEILAAVKHAFGVDQEAYERLYLEPRIINRKLHAWFNRNSEVHRQERAAIEKAYSLVQSEKSLKDAAQLCNLDFSTYEYGETEKELPSELQKYFPEKPVSQDQPMIAILENLSEGEVFRNIIEDDYSYRVIRLVEKKEKKYKIEAVSVKKRSFAAWFQGQCAKLRVQILDEGLKKEIAAAYPNMWWVRKLCEK